MTIWTATRPIEALPHISGQIVAFTLGRPDETVIDVNIFRSPLDQYPAGQICQFVLTPESFATPGDTIDGNDLITGTPATAIALPTRLSSSRLPYLFNVTLSSPPSGGGGPKTQPQMQMVPPWLRGPRR